MVVTIPVSSLQCPACGSDGARESAFHFLGKLLDSPEVFYDNRSQGCGFGWLTPRPTEKEFDAQYGEKYFAAYAGARSTSWFHADYGWHMNFFNERSLTLAVEKVGLQRSEVSYSQYVNQFTNGWIVAQQNVFEKQLQLSEVVPDALRDSKARSWKLLIKTFLARPASRYTCMRMIAQKRLR